MCAEHHKIFKRKQKYLLAYRLSGKHRESVYKNAYGFSSAEKDARIVRQGGMCGNPGCQTTEPGGRRGWNTDHCHVTNKVRDELCTRCNLALGMVKDDPKKLAGLILYLEKHGVSLWATAF